MSLFDKIFIIFFVLLLLVIFIPLIYFSSDNTYHYAYIDINGSLGVSPRCRHNKCEDLNGQVIEVIDFIDLRE